MKVYNYPAPRAPGHKKPTSLEECLPNARIFAKKQHGRAAMGPVKKGDKIFIVTLPGLDENVKAAVIQALKEAGAEKVDFAYEHELGAKAHKTFSVQDGWDESVMMQSGERSVERPERVGARKYLEEHPEYTTIFMGTGGRTDIREVLGEHGHKFRNNWIFNDWEEFICKAWTFPDELWIEIERPVIESIGKASMVRISDPEGTSLEFPLTEEEALRWQRTAWLPGHLFMDPLQATSEECGHIGVSPDFPPVFPGINGVLAGTANPRGYFPRIEIYFEQGRLVEVKGGGKYGDAITEIGDRYKNVHWPGYPDKGFWWYCDCALCTNVRAHRRTSDRFSSYQKFCNSSERNRSGIFHQGFGARVHGKEFMEYAKEHNLPLGHIHVQNYFTNYEIKLRGSGHWLKIVDKGHLTSLDDPKIRALAVKYGDPDQLLKEVWVPPLPGINCEGDYLKDYAPDPVAYQEKRLKEGKSI